jgi:hypothetical protein
MECLSIVYIQDHWLGLYWGRELQRRVSIFKLISLSIVTALITISSIKESAVAKKGVSTIALGGDLGLY